MTDEQEPSTAPQDAADRDRASRGCVDRDRAGQQKWLAGASVALVFLLIPMVQVALSSSSLGEIAVFEIPAACFGAVYLCGPLWAADGLFVFATNRRAVMRCAGVLLLMTALTIPMIAVGGPGVAGLWIYIGVTSAILFELRWAASLAVVLAGAMIMIQAAARSGAESGTVSWELAVVLVALTLWMGGFVDNIRTNRELHRARNELARTAVVAERERIGRDLHDILGHSLTAIAVKAGLARRLVERDTAAAAGEVGDIETLARDALADVRATAAGYRNVSLAGELAVARSVLDAAGIEVEMPSAVDGVIPAGREVFGYVVREAVTNVVRHSGARWCSIELTPTSVTVIDDGRLGAAPGEASARRGSGLSGLTERLASVGGSLETTPRAGGGFRVVATVPGAEPTRDPVDRASGDRHVMAERRP